MWRICTLSVESWAKPSTAVALSSGDAQGVTTAHQSLERFHGLGVAEGWEGSSAKRAGEDKNALHCDEASYLYECKWKMAECVVDGQQESL